MKTTGQENNKFEKRKYLFVSYDGLITDTAWTLVKEGHEVKYSIQNPADKEVGDGFVPKVDNWEEHTDWADVIIFDESALLNSDYYKSRINFLIAEYFDKYNKAKGEENRNTTTKKQESRRTKGRRSLGMSEMPSKLLW